VGNAIISDAWMGSSDSATLASQDRGADESWFWEAPEKQSISQERERIIGKGDEKLSWNNPINYNLNASEETA
jgi:hypothetical protein